MKRFLVGVSVLGGLLLARPASADPTVTGLIAAKYKALQGVTGPLGRPTGNEIDAKEGKKGRYQTFEHGVIGWTPSTGSKSLQVAYIKNHELVFEWGDVSPFNYDFFLVRWDLNGRNVGQDEIKGRSRTNGRWSKRLNSGGRYRLIVEGGIKHIGGSKFRQGWSNPLYVTYSAPGPDYTRYQPRVKERAPAARQVRQFMPKDLYLKEWMRLGGPDGPMGLPTSGVRPHGGGAKGGYVQFQNGQVSYSPSVWQRGIVGAYQEGGDIVVDWIVSWGEPHPASQFHYDRFIVRWDLNGKNVGQTDINADGGKDDTHLRTRGFWRLSPDRSGNYAILIEGARVPTVGHVKARQGWMHAVTVQFVMPPKDPQAATLAGVKMDPHAVVSLKHVPPATSVADAKAKFDRRIAAAILHNACSPLPHTIYKNEENFGIIALAKLAYPDYFQSDHLPGRNYRVRDEVIEALRRQQVGSKAGTSNDSIPKRTGEYDVALTMLISIIYKYYDVLPADVQNHIINDLLNKRGPFDSGDQRPFSPVPIPESENHLMMIESARYLTNQLLYRRGGNPKYDNARNGMDEWMLKHLRQFLTNDFIEYNARPYQDYTTSALLNLYSYTSARNPSSARVKMAAHMVLDYLMAKVAVSSNDSRRSVTYRRKSSYHTADFIRDHYDPQTAFSMALAGTTDMVSQAGSLPNNFAWEMQWAGLSDYRLPDLVLDLMVNRSHRVFFQRFHHYADEAYASSPSYLISSGGHYATFAYKVAGKGKHDDIGLALPTSLMPTGQFTSAAFLLRFSGASKDEKRSNMGVAPDFACGLNPVLPDVYKAAATGVDSKGVRTRGNLKTEPWTFIDQSKRTVGRYANGPHGYYVAFYHRGGFGFLEAYDTALHPGLKFSEFMAQVLKRNGTSTFRIKGRNSYVMTDGRKIQFTISPDSVVHLAAEKPFFVKGTVLNGAEKTGVITLQNPSTHRRIVLDMRNWKAPKRTES